MCHGCAMGVPWVCHGCAMCVTQVGHSERRLPCVGSGAAATTGKRRRNIRPFRGAFGFLLLLLLPAGALLARPRGFRFIFFGFHTAPHHTLRHTTPHHPTPHHTTPHHTTPHATPHHTPHCTPHRGRPHPPPRPSPAQPSPEGGHQEKYQTKQ